MNEDDVLNLQTEIFKSVFDFTEFAEDGVSAVGELHAAPKMIAKDALDEKKQSQRSRLRNGKRRVEDDVALGIVPAAGKGGAKLAVLVQNRLILKSEFVDRIRKKAKDEVEVIYIGRQRPLWVRSRSTPLRLGASISPTTRNSAGTLGCFCRDNANGQTSILSNNHVLASVNQNPLGTAIIQQGRLDGGNPNQDVVATLSRFVPIQFGGIPNRVDAAIAQVVNHGRGQDLRNIFDSRTPPNSVTAMQPRSPVSAVQRMRVLKTGRTTAHTQGTVLAVNANNVMVNMGVGVARFDGQITIGMNMTPARPFAQRGDSGSLIVDTAGRPLGLLFSGSASGGPGNMGVINVNPISAVTAQMGVSLI